MQASGFVLGSHSAAFTTITSRIRNPQHVRSSSCCCCCRSYARLSSAQLTCSRPHSECRLLAVRRSDSGGKIWPTNTNRFVNTNAPSHRFVILPLLTVITFKSKDLNNLLQTRLMRCLKCIILLSVFLSGGNIS